MPSSEYAKAHIAQCYTGNCTKQDQKGEPSVFESYPFMDPGHRLHDVWEGSAAGSRVLEEHGRAKSGSGPTWFASPGLVSARSLHAVSCWRSAATLGTT